jgi:parvulin-like peptidyl-prolyl isomerase
MLWVNGEAVAPELIEGEFRAIKSHAESLGNMSCCERDPEFRSLAQDNVVARVLLNQEAQRRALDVTEEEIDAALAGIESEHGGREALLAHLGLHPCQIEEVRSDITNGLRVEKTLRACLGPLAEPTGEEIRAWYDSHLEEFLTEEEVRATHLFKQVAKAEDRQRIYDELRQWRRRALAGEDFAQLAHDHTDKEDKLTDLGWFKQRDFMDEFSTIVFSLEEGEMSPVFPSYFGLHLAQCTGRRPPVAQPFEDVREEVRRLLVTADQQEKSRQLVGELRSRAVIEDREDAIATPP